MVDTLINIVLYTPGCTCTCTFCIYTVYSGMVCSKLLDIIICYWNIVRVEGAAV
jgi:tRNA A37 methylthiotransferase MiaB